MGQMSPTSTYIGSYNQLLRSECTIKDPHFPKQGTHKSDKQWVRNALCSMAEYFNRILGQKLITENKFCPLSGYVGRARNLGLSFIKWASVSMNL